MQALTKRLISAGLIGFLLSLAVQCFAADKLLNIENKLREDSDIEHLSVQQIQAQLLNSAQDLIIFDIREPKEYLVSHLENAIQVSPGINPADFIKQYSGLLNNNNIVFYCSTGRRSTKLAEAVKQTLNEQHSDLSIPANMQGGIFRWHNNQQALVNEQGSTEFIHPFNWYWKRLLVHKDKTQYKLK